MIAQDVRRMLAEAAEEIRRLRHTAELQGAKIEGFEMAFALVQAQPLRPGGTTVGVDIAWEIDRMLQAAEGK
jgi:hypothetical protein